jgi:hypothetical protein
VEYTDEVGRAWAHNVALQTCLPHRENPT